VAFFLRYVIESQYVNSLRAKLSGDLIPVWGIFCTLQTGPGAHPTSYTMDTRSFPEIKRLGRGIDYLSPSSIRDERKSRVIHLLPLRTFMTCSGVNFYFIL